MFHKLFDQASFWPWPLKSSLDLFIEVFRINRIDENTIIVLNQILYINKHNRCLSKKDLPHQMARTIIALVCEVQC